MTKRAEACTTRCGRRAVARLRIPLQYLAQGDVVTDPLCAKCLSQLLASHAEIQDRANAEGTPLLEPKVEYL